MTKEEIFSAFTVPQEGNDCKVTKVGQIGGNGSSITIYIARGHLKISTTYSVQTSDWADEEVDEVFKAIRSFIRLQDSAGRNKLLKKELL